MCVLLPLVEEIAQWFWDVSICPPETRIIPPNIPNRSEEIEIWFLGKAGQAGPSDLSTLCSEI